MKLNGVTGVKITAENDNYRVITTTKPIWIDNDLLTTGTISTSNSSFYNDDMLDYLLKDIIKEKAKDAEEKLKKETIQFNKKVADGINNDIKQVIFNDPATIIVWKDGHKTVVKCEKGDTYNKEFGLALCLIKEFFNNTGAYNKIFEKWIKE